MEGLDRVGVATVLAAHAAHQVGVALVTQLNAHLHELGNARVDGRKRVVRQQLLGEVLRNELSLNVVAAEAERRLGEVVGAEAEEVGLGGDFVSGHGSARQLDHGANGKLELNALLLGDFCDNALSDAAHLVELLHRGNQRDHDLGLGIEAFLLELGSSGRNSAHLHLGKDGIHDAQTAAAQAQHRVLLSHGVDLVHELTLRCDFLRVGASGLHAGDFHIEGTRALEELMQGRVEQANDNRQAVHSLEHAVEVARLSLEQLLDGFLANLFVLVQDEGLNDLLALAQEHMLGAVEANALGAEVAGKLRVGRVVGVGANAQAAILVGPFQNGVEVAGELRHNQVDSAQNNDAGGAVERNHVALVNHDIGAGKRGFLLLGVDLELLNAADARSAHATGNNGSMAGLAAMAGENTLGGDHASEVVGSGLPANEHALLAFFGGLHSVGGREHGTAHSSARRSVQATGEHIVVGVLVELRVQQLVELSGVDAAHSLFLGDEAFFFHLNGDVQRGGGGTLAHAGLQHPQLALLDCELDVAHVAIVVLENGEHTLELLAGFLQAVDMLQLGDGARVANARDDVFALGVHQVVAVEFLLAVCGVAGKRNAGSGSLALVAEHHALHVNGGTQIVGNLVLLAVEHRARVVPAAEHGLDGQLQLNVGVLREGDRAINDELGMLFGRNVLGENLLEFGNEFLQVFSGKLGVALHAASELLGGNGVFEQVAVEAHNHVREHLDEAAIAVPREAGVVGVLDEAVNRLVVQTKVQNRVHHAGHRHGGAGTNGNEQRIFGIANALADTLLEVEAILLNGIERAFGPRVIRVCIFHTGLAGDGEARRHGQANEGHFGEVRALAAKDVLHILVAFGNVVALSVLAERVDTLNVCSQCLLLTYEV